MCLKDEHTLAHCRMVKIPESFRRIPEWQQQETEVLSGVIGTFVAQENNTPTRQLLLGYIFRSLSR